MKKVFIDGAQGTTGLRIHERLNDREDLELIRLPEEKRKDPQAIAEALNASDLSFLCLPDDAAREAVSMVTNPETVILDTSTAHRTSEGWAYGFPELSGKHREAILKGKRIAVPGCHASGFIALVEPLVRAGVVSPESALCAFSLTGYSGGGKKMIADYDEKLAQDGASRVQYLGGRQYALAQKHKHLPEMSKICGLAKLPVFSPVVVPHLSGMEVTVQLHDADVDAIRACYEVAYGKDAPGLVRYVENPDETGFLSSAGLTGRDDMEVSVFGNGERTILVSRFDNLGKGASGAAIQNMNLVLGADEREGLVTA